jgi:hypothetical protein
VKAVPLPATFEEALLALAAAAPRPRDHEALLNASAQHSIDRIASHRVP